MESFQKHRIYHFSLIIELPVFLLKGSENIPFVKTRMCSLIHIWLFDQPQKNKLLFTYLSISVPFGIFKVGCYLFVSSWKHLRWSSVFHTNSDLKDWVKVAWKPTLFTDHLSSPFTFCLVSYEYMYVLNI